jgi:hypothetical protein
MGLPHRHRDLPCDRDRKPDLLPEEEVAIAIEPCTSARTKLCASLLADKALSERMYTAKAAASTDAKHRERLAWRDKGRSLDGCEASGEAGMARYGVRPRRMRSIGRGWHGEIWSAASTDAKHRERLAWRDESRSLDGRVSD